MNTQNKILANTAEEKYLLHLFSKYTNNQHTGNAVSQHSWQIMVYTLGRFRILCNDIGQNDRCAQHRFANV